MSRESEKQPGFMDRFRSPRPAATPTPGTAPPTPAKSSTSIGTGLPARPVLDLVREILVAVAQFTIPSPDLNSRGFVERILLASASLGEDLTQIQKTRTWALSALPAYANLQRGYLAAREEEIRHLLQLYNGASATAHGKTRELSEAVLESHSRMREVVRIEDIRAVRTQLEEEIKGVRDLVEAKSRDDKERAARLSAQVKVLEQALEEVRGLADFDTLTGLVHRGGLERRLKTMMADPRGCSLAFIDLDNFKTINDTLGHLVGDRLLKYVAQQLQKVSRSADVAARYGGDEFCLAVVGITPEMLAQRLGPLISRRHINLEQDGKVCSVLLSATVGIAQSVPGESVSSILERADRALLNAKAQDKGEIVLAAPPRPKPA